MLSLNEAGGTADRRQHGSSELTASALGARGGDKEGDTHEKVRPTGLWVCHRGKPRRAVGKRGTLEYSLPSWLHPCLLHPKRHLRVLVAQQDVRNTCRWVTGGV